MENPFSNGTCSGSLGKKWNTNSNNYSNKIDQSTHTHTRKEKDTQNMHASHRIAPKSKKKRQNCRPKNKKGACGIMYQTGTRYLILYKYIESEWTCPVRVEERERMTEGERGRGEKEREDSDSDICVDKIRVAISPLTITIHMHTHIDSRCCCYCSH